MFNIGLIEFLIIFFVFLLLIKPEDFPKISKNFGLLYRKASRYFYNFKHEFSNLDIDSEFNSEINEKKTKKKKIRIFYEIY